MSGKRRLDQDARPKRQLREMVPPMVPAAAARERDDTILPASPTMRMLFYLNMLTGLVVAVFKETIHTLQGDSRSGQPVRNEEGVPMCLMSLRSFEMVVQEKTDKMLDVDARFDNMKAEIDAYGAAHPHVVQGSEEYKRMVEMNSKLNDLITEISEIEDDKEKSTKDFMKCLQARLSDITDGGPHDDREINREAAARDHMEFADTLLPTVIEYNHDMHDRLPTDNSCLRQKDAVFVERAHAGLLVDTQFHHTPLCLLATRVNQKPLVQRTWAEVYTDPVHGRQLAQTQGQPPRHSFTWMDADDHVHTQEQMRLRTTPADFKRVAVLYVVMGWQIPRYMEYPYAL